MKGRYFGKAETLTEFKRIQAMAGVIPRILPPGTPAYAKGGSIEWDDFNCLPVTFCFTLNWEGAPSTIPTGRR